jgi:hypothetical protein
MHARRDRLSPMSSSDPDTTRDPFAAFEANLRKVVSVPKKELTKRLKAFKKRKRRRAR